MSKLLIHNGLRVSHSPSGGFGVFTDVDIVKDSIVEQCHTLIFDRKSTNGLPDLLSRYVFQWKNDKFNQHLNEILCLPLGFGGIYNHNKDYNVIYDYEWINVDGEVRPITTYKANRDIKAGEELFVNYGSEYFKYFNIKEV